MPITNLQLIVLTGKYLTLDGNVASGTLTFTPSVTLVNSVANEIVIPKAFSAVLSGGTFSISLPATNDPDLAPQGWTYAVTEVVGGQTRNYSIVLPYDAAGATLDIADLAPTDPSMGLWVPIAGNPTGTAAGDLSGTYPNPTVAKVNGTSVPSGPVAGRVLTATSTTAATWQAPAGGAPTGTATGDLSGSYPGPTVAKVNGVTVSGTPTANQVPVASTGTAAAWGASPSSPPNGTATGDLSGSYPNPTVAKVNGVAVTGTPTAGQVPTATSGTAATWQTPSGGGGGAGTTTTVTQTAHGFTVGQILYLLAGVYTLARADSVAAAEVVGMVASVTNANTFVLATGGQVTGLTGLTAGAVYFLSPTTAGGFTTTEPSTAGQVSKALFIADTTTSCYFVNYRGMTVAGAGATAPSGREGYVNGGSAGTVSTISLASGTVVRYLLNSATCTFTFPTVANDGAYSFTLVLVQDATGSRLATFPGSVVWAGGTGPTLTTTGNKRDVFSFLSYDGGTTWLGFVAGQNYT